MAAVSLFKARIVNRHVHGNRGENEDSKSDSDADEEGKSDERDEFRLAGAEACRFRTLAHRNDHDIVLMGSLPPSGSLLGMQSLPILEPTYTKTSSMSTNRRRKIFTGLGLGEKPRKTFQWRRTYTFIRSL